MSSWGFLPILSIHKDAASFTHSVLPFYSAALEHISEYRNIFEIYATTNPFVTGTFLSVVVSISVFLISSYTGNYSWYFLTVKLLWLITSGWIDFGAFCQSSTACTIMYSLPCMA